MEAQLAEYRARKQRERAAEGSISTKVASLFGKGNDPPSSNQSSTDTPVTSVPRQSHPTRRADRSSTLSASPQHVYTTEQTIGEPSRGWKYYVPLSLKILLWLLLWKYFVFLGFGAVYFIVTCSIFMYMNTGTRARGTLSAYSVFNPNQERLDGTFTAEQFEGELRHGIGSVR